MKIISKKFQKSRDEFHKQLKINHVTWHGTGSRLLFYVSQLAKDIIAFMVDAMVFHYFTNYIISVELDGQYAQRAAYMIQFQITLGAVLVAGLTIWVAHYILHNTLHYPKYLCYLDKKHKRDENIQAKAQSIEDRGRKEHEKRKAQRKHKRAMRKLKKK